MSTTSLSVVVKKDDGEEVRATLDFDSFRAMRVETQNELLQGILANVEIALKNGLPAARVREARKLLAESKVTLWKRFLNLGKCQEVAK